MRRIGWLVLVAMMLLTAVASAEGYELPITLDALTEAPAEYYVSDHEYKDETLHVLLEEMEYKGSTAYVAWWRSRIPLSCARRFAARSRM